MAKKKYATFSDPMTENPTWECTKRKCKWQGKDSEKENVRTDPEYLIFEKRCPNCEYTILSTPPPTEFINQLLNR